jgi:hypothetical protein
VLLMMSKRASKMPWVNFEAGGAWALGRPVIPVRYGNMKEGDLPKPYSSFQASSFLWTRNTS